MNETSLGRAVAQVLRSELAARQIDTSAEFASMVAKANPGARTESGTNIWRKVNGVVKITFDDLDRYSAALGMTTEEVVALAVELQRTGQVHQVTRRATRAQLAESVVADMPPDEAADIQASRAQHRRRRAQA